MSRGPFRCLDEQIRCELARVEHPHPPAEACREEVTESGAQPRLVHALRAVLDECVVLDTDPDTVQLAEDIRVVIAIALRLDD